MLLTQKISLTADEIREIVKLYIMANGYDVIGDLEIGIDYTNEKIGKGRFDNFHRKAVLGTTVVTVQPRVEEEEEVKEEKPKINTPAQ